ncbi:DUF5689 domain-containing protein [Robiginitalea sp. M366]|uniref:DUF5689 domain-containing protein n=1 Tax=Robiginitalea aestuariiviva TaxID=3036903 RepID=UPI00240E67CC|nr:DUF5689 domain-containing protein [Robiginitalea aestuariiviva]MDG1571677.1 DUF5689 domain-containing protein [Robiginitalea aestuariiviva]
MEFLGKWPRLGQWALFGAFLTLTGCTSPEPDSESDVGCEIPEMEGVGFQVLEAYGGDAVVEITDPIYVEGYVISSDREGNIFGRLYVQDQLENPAYGVELKTDLLDLQALFPPGARVRINLQGLFLGRQGGGMALGSRRDIFGNPVLDRIPALATLDYLTLACTPGGTPIPREVSLDSLNPSYLHTLVRIPELEVEAGAQGQPFAEAGSQTRIPLVSCSGHQLELDNSGYSDFQALPLPAGSGAVTGILVGSSGNFRLLLRTAADLDFEPLSCLDRYPLQTTDQVIISEIADPDNEAGARFIELYNAGAESIALRGWSLVRYTNDNTSPGLQEDLTGLEIGPGQVLVFTASEAIYKQVYGRDPDRVFRPNGPADSNGDDNILLLDPFGTIIDAFGVPGEDGSGTAHEFEDGRALRLPRVFQASAAFQPAQWMLWNDTGAAGTQLQPRQAPADFTPGLHPDPSQ